jgi:hypothetical protein
MVNDRRFEMMTSRMESPPSFFPGGMPEMAMKRKPAPLRRIKQILAAEAGNTRYPFSFDFCSHERAWCDGNEDER